jgi:glucose/arabinose dehydrogenase
MKEPVVIWIPSIGPSGLAFYTGDPFPQWRGNLFVGALMEGRISGTGHLERIVFNESGEELRREALLRELRQRIRDVRQGPDGLLYLLTEESRGALLRLEPIEDIGAGATTTAIPERRR